MRAARHHSKGCPPTLDGWSDLHWSCFRSVYLGRKKVYNEHSLNIVFDVQIISSFKSRSTVALNFFFNEIAG